MNSISFNDFVKFVISLKGDEKGEAQTFCDRLFRVFGHQGFLEAGGIFEARIKEKIKDGFSKTHFADALWCPIDHSGVLIEMKKRGEKDLEKHFPQARDYWCQMNPQEVLGPGAQKPKYIVLCNFDRFIIYDNLLKVDEISIQEIPNRWTALNFLLPDEQEPVFQNNICDISEQVARHIGELFKHLVFDLKYDREKVRRFILQCVVALFSEDVGLLSRDFFLHLIRDAQKRGNESFDLFGGLFRQMGAKESAEGGRFRNVQYFNGGLFEKVTPLELDAVSLKCLEEASLLNWCHVDPTIFGGLFEGTMNEKSRHKFGAHFTHANDIYKIIYPSIIRPWTEKIQKADSLTKLRETWDELSRFRVLDPACGCGNFLFLAFQALKDLEMQIIEKIASTYSVRSTAKLKLGMSRISPKQFYGIDIQPMAVELTKVTLMIAKELASIRWNERVASFTDLTLDFDIGLPFDNLDENILCQDAILEPWPEFDCIIGNPPYQAKNKMSAEMDAVYINKIRESYPEIPGRADFCVYWFHKAHQLMKPGQRAGLVGTNTIRQNYSREGGLDYITKNEGTITDAVSSQIWSGEAAVYVSIVNWVKGPYEKEKTLTIQRGNRPDSPFEITHPKAINASLSFSLDVSRAKSLAVNANSHACYQGQTHGHEGFLLEREFAENILKKHPNYARVLFPFLNGEELLNQKNAQPTRFVIDFRGLDCFTAAQYSELFEIVQKKVWPDKKEKAAKERLKNEEASKKDSRAKGNRDHANDFKTWWQLFRARDEVMDILSTIPRYIACSRLTKRPIFEFIDSNIHPSDALAVFPLPDDYSFGILQSSIHWGWFMARCSTLGETPRYTSNTVFDSFPWPQNPSKKQVLAVSEAARELRQKRLEIMNENGLSLRDLCKKIEETPNNPVNEFQKRLDAKVREAFGMTKKEDSLTFLLKLNEKLSQQELNGDFVQGPGLPQMK